jgi:hypothetical protein
MHDLLAAQYVAMLEAGESDPRILKEVREFLKDNSVTGDVIGLLNTATKEDVIELPEDYMPFEMVNNG